MATEAQTTTDLQGEAPCPEPGPAIFAYDGSDLAGYAIEQAGFQLSANREALRPAPSTPCGRIAISIESDRAQTSPARAAAGTAARVA